MRNPAPVRAAPGAQVPAVERHPLAHSRETVAGAELGRLAGRGTAVVGDLQLELVGPVAHGDLRANPAGVLARVGQRLLDDATGRQVDARRQRPRVALGHELDGQLATARLLDELRQAVRPGLRHERRDGALPAKHAERAAHLGP